MSISGSSESIGNPAASITATIAISLIWITAVYIKNEKQLILTLVFVGIAYAVIAMIISGVLSPILTGTLQGPFTNPFAIVSVLLKI